MAVGTWSFIKRRPAGHHCGNAGLSKVHRLTRSFELAFISCIVSVRDSIRLSVSADQPGLISNDASAMTTPTKQPASR
jgi:hypothetical protein